MQPSKMFIPFAILSSLAYIGVLIPGGKAAGE